MQHELSDPKPPSARLMQRRKSRVIPTETSVARAAEESPNSVCTPHNRRAQDPSAPPAAPVGVTNEDVTSTLPPSVCGIGRLMVASSIGTAAVSGQRSAV
jgi:hypothetical protein